MLPSGARLTDALVAMGCFAGLGVVAWYLLPLGWAIVALALALYEGYTLANNHPEDTISEAVWRFSDKYALLPLAGGALLSYGIATGYISDPIVVAMLSLLAGHFWFPRYNKKLMDD